MPELNGTVSAPFEPVRNTLEDSVLAVLGEDLAND
jgi:hypothetical protein